MASRPTTTSTTVPPGTPIAGGQASPGYQAPPGQQIIGVGPIQPSHAVHIGNNTAEPVIQLDADYNVTYIRPDIYLDKLTLDLDQLRQLSENVKALIYDRERGRRLAP